MQISQTNQLITKALFGLASVLAFATIASAQNASEEEGVEEIIVTGSFIRGTPEDAPNPVTIVTRDDLLRQGNPTIVELIRSLGPSSGTDGETNQFQSNGLEGAANINLRGLGPARTLTLFNGKRLPYSGVPATQLAYQSFVNINLIPLPAIGRFEVLRDGASATYGSDAVGGVANFITRDDFVGFEIQGSHRMVADSDGWTDIGAVWGADLSDDSHILVAFGSNERGELRIRDRDYALRPYAENIVGGWSSTANPGSLRGNGVTFQDPACANLAVYLGTCRFRFAAFDNLIETEERSQVYAEWDHAFAGGSKLEVSGLISSVDVPEWKTSPSYPPVDGSQQRVSASHPGFIKLVNDVNSGEYSPSPSNAGTSGLCTFEQAVGGTTYNLWYLGGIDTACTNGPVAGTKYTGYDVVGGVVRINSFTASRTRVAAVLDNPNTDEDESADEITAVVGVDATGAPVSSVIGNDNNVLFAGRYLGWGAQGPAVGSRTYDTTNITADYDFAIANGDIDVNLSFSTGTVDTSIISTDTLAQRLTWGLQGVGGPKCGTAGEKRLKDDGTPIDTLTPGEDGCLYYNPFSNAIQRSPYGLAGNEYINTDNPRYDSTLTANSPELLDWLAQQTFTDLENSLTVFEGVFTGELGDLAGGTIGWAGGAQLRMEEYTGDYGGFNDGEDYPCTNELVRTRGGTDGCGENEVGVWAFLAPGIDFSYDEQVIAFFGELALPLLSNLDLQVALRYESYDTAGDSIDPKVSVRWDPISSVSVRGSFGTSFKAPQLSQNSLNNATSLSFVNALGAFKAIDTSTIPGGLEPEAATNINLGVIIDIGNFFLTADYWSIAVDSPILTENHNAILAGACPNGTCDPSQPLFKRITFPGIAKDRMGTFGLNTGVVSRIAVQVYNGSELSTAGLDITARYRFEGNTPIIIGMEWSQLSEYTLNGTDFLGGLNQFNAAVRPLPEDKMRFFVNVDFDRFSINGSYSTVSDYVADPDPFAAFRGGLAIPATVDSYGRFDVNGAYSIDENSVVFVSIDNLTDEEPPLAATDLSYDAYTHSPLGQTIKVGVNYQF